MAEDHGGLLRVLAQLETLAPSRDIRAALVSSIRFVRATLRDPQTALFAGSQDADEEYFELPLEERREREAPFVDRTSYTNWTCGLAGALLFAGRALDDDLLVREGCDTLDAVAERLIDADGLAYHVLRPGETARGARVARPTRSRISARSIDAHEITGEERFLERARDLADRMLASFQASDGGFYDRIDIEETIGRLERSDRPIAENGVLAESLLRLSALTHDDAYRTAAVRTLKLFAPASLQAGSFAAAYARAVRRFTSLHYTLRIVGNPQETDGFREVASRLPALAAVGTVPPGAASEAGLPASPVPAAYACTDSACGPPVTDPAGLRAAYDQLAKLAATPGSG